MGASTKPEGKEAAMADYCSNKVTFTGENQEQALEYFAEMGYDSPPFHDILTDNDAVHFESRWIPPMKDLNEIAEMFDVNYTLVYQLPNERAKVKYQYTCLQNERLSKHAGVLRRQINGAGGQPELDKLEEILHEQADRSLFNNHERTILAQLLGKKYIALNDQQSQQHITPIPARKIGR